jgi:CO dehydrogenase/acetyl-CoA synthase delta subunit
MSTEPLILDLVESVAAAPRPHEEVIEAVPTPDSVGGSAERGLIAMLWETDGALLVRATEAGREALARAGRLIPARG